MRRSGWFVAGVIAVAAATWLLWPKGAQIGNARFFKDQTYNFETIRVLTDTAPVGGDLAEVTLAVAKIKTGDAESWYAAWSEQGDRIAALAAKTTDATSKGDALLRAHTYYRAAEFFLDPHDPKRAAIWKKNLAAFYSGLDTLSVQYERISVPYGPGHHLNAVYFPGGSGAEAKPLIVMVGGFDSTMEELYFHFVAAAHRRGYSVLIYEGPGQGSVLRDQGLTFIADWEKPNSAVLDTFLASHPKPEKIVLIGESLGGYLAPRAAAFDPRIDGVIAYDAIYNAGEMAKRQVPKFVYWLRDHNYTGVLKLLSHRPQSPGSEWAAKNGMWTFGLSDPLAVADAFQTLTLEPVADRIGADVLLLAGTDDHFTPNGEIDKIKSSLTHARSVTSVVFDHASGGSEHCQLGAPSLWQSTVFDWIAKTYG
ncbi:MAG: alpha/beta fold hydrolase [Parvibaculum sp.]|uniref:alpha/beta hydrolase family protein n=1 Tax=Parvibaculum sp. TaxID=2024848 RepID=UPI00284E0A2A|nr:alpha/beta fold hydrolase [Parvibaculum sp.]MDR3498483.1 alpha/beta fold hydrolase [Parvibaculum sp.]